MQGILIIPKRIWRRVIKMMMEPFYERFPDIAEKETRCLIVMNEESGLPKGEYFLIESYCNRANCDCRRVFINISSKDMILATIGYGWESIEFYEQWMGGKELVKDVKGPILELTGQQTAYSKTLLELFEKVMLTDALFIERLKRHYTMFKKNCKENESIDEDINQDLEHFDPDLHTISSLCKETGTGIDAISDKNKEAFYPILMRIEETIRDWSLEDRTLKDSDVIESLKKIRDNLFSESTKFNELEKRIINNLKLVLFLNKYDKRDVSLSISCVLRSAKLHRSISGSRGYLTFVSQFFNAMKQQGRET